MKSGLKKPVDKKDWEFRHKSVVWVGHQDAWRVDEKGKAWLSQMNTLNGGAYQFLGREHSIHDSKNIICFIKYGRTNGYSFVMGVQLGASEKDHQIA